MLFDTHHKQQPVISSKWPVKPHPEKKNKKYRARSFVKINLKRSTAIVIYCFQLCFHYFHLIRKYICMFFWEKYLVEHNCTTNGSKYAKEFVHFTTSKEEFSCIGSPDRLVLLVYVFKL